METVEARRVQAERIQSFDITANVDAMRLDISLFGGVLPETREQTTNEQLTFLVEAVDRAARTPFTLQRDETGDLCYFDDGKMRPYGNMIQTGVEAAEADALIDPRRKFLADWTRNDYSHYLQMRKLKPGERHSWSSTYPIEEEQKFGAEFLAECGLQPDRKMGFLYQATCLEDGSVELESQTIDGGDQDAIAAAMDRANIDPNANLDELLNEHDRVLEQKYGAKFYAGRINESRHQNAWNELRKNSDLTEYLMDGLEKIAKLDLPRELTERQTKQHIYGVWALFKKRLDGTAEPIPGSNGIVYEGVNVMPRQVLLDRQVTQAFNEFASSGKVLSGCGGSVSFASGENDVLNTSASDVFKSIFGGKANVDKFGSLDFDCPSCHKTNHRPRNQLLKRCQHCHSTKVAC